MDRQGEGEIMDIQAEADAYARADFSQVNQAFVDRLLELTGATDSAVALDLGTGPADIPVRLIRTLRRRGGAAWRIVAIEASRPMLDHARRIVRQAGFESQIELLPADAKDTRLPSLSFDVIFSNSILHHISQVDQFWAELKRLARPGAAVFLRDLARPPTAEDARRIVMQYVAAEPELLQREYHRSLLSAYTVREVRDQLDRGGLTGLDVRMVTDRHFDVWGRICR